MNNKIYKFSLIVCVILFSNLLGLAESTNNYNKVEFLLSDIDLNSAPFSALPSDYSTTYHTLDLNFKAELFDQSGQLIKSETKTAIKVIYNIDVLTLMFLVKILWVTHM